MKKIYLIVLLFLNLSHAQNNEVVNWIDKNAVVIEDANPNTPLTYLKEHRPDMFSGVTLFGFGEATHYTKEFFDMKVKFFKYLVENEGVTLFLMEDLYSNFYEINNFIKGGEGDARQLTGNLGFALWRNEEVLGLIEWMKGYNEGKPEDKQVKFYGVDCQSGINTNVDLKRFIAKYNVKTEQGAEAVLDSCATLNIFSKSKDSDKVRDYLVQLKNLQDDIQNNFKPGNKEQTDDLNNAVYTLTVLKQFTGFFLEPSQQYRDKCMADNVQLLLKQHGAAAKGFIWAHNGHVSKEDTKYKRLGMHLKNIFGNAYYSMGFIYGKGKLWGMKINKNKEAVGVVYTLTSPEKKTPAAVFDQAKHATFFIDFKEASKNSAMSSFLNAKLKCMDTGASGFNPRWWGVKAKLAEMYDGIIFIEDVSLPKYLPGRVRDIMQNPAEQITISR